MKLHVIGAETFDENLARFVYGDFDYFGIIEKRP